MQITRGKRARAQRVVIYGPEGIGKSSFAAQFPDPLFIDTEGSTDNMDVARMDKPTSYTMLKNQIAFVKANPTVCKTLVIDTIDWAESLIVDDVCAQHSKKGIEDFNWGNGYTYTKEEMGRFLNMLQELIELGINVVLTAHAQMRKFEQPDEMGAYDRWELKLGKKTSSQTTPLVKEWADMVLFANYKTVVMTSETKKKKATGGQRMLYTEHHPAWDAKNRHGLPSVVPLDYAVIAHIFAQVPTQPVPQTPPVQETPKPQSEHETAHRQVEQQPMQSTSAPVAYPPSLPKALIDLMATEQVTPDDLVAVANIRGHFPPLTPIENFPPDYWNMIVANWQATLEVIKTQVRTVEMPFTMEEA
ncbi:phage protein [Streptococcus equi subsp. equi]|uniref:ATP-binding protein n=1 Tax=Streptococcus equi TaxID=1336 RepID=UPI000659C8F1|nr:ATP-binding protein [Streptococcus equi]MBT1229636.1 ATP-binding protein [Streptococcus equi subsp. equi]MBT1231767.1 ATP-binding protein [Streptococcus equi subsp. equi]MBT1237055.1 ATP-binding protein [Streptococcus equi subsp. equi]MBT1240370.1 ATP-binding protein [Streptococcus equi subsp. equi]MBT1246390.1 ATP-binding protein [Streptococcus equi subsp. equi]